MDFKKYERMANSTQSEAFRLEAFKELGVEDNIENNLVFQQAWRYGYAGGFEEVFEHFKDLVAIQKENQE